MLTGTELLVKVKELGEASRTELVRATGYVCPKKGGGERLLFSAFYDAVLEAKGLTLGRSPGEDKGKRRLSHTTRVQFNGNLMVGKAYTALLDLKPGDAFQIQLGRRARSSSSPWRHRTFQKTAPDWIRRISRSSSWGRSNHQRRGLARRSPRPSDCWCCLAALLLTEGKGPSSAGLFLALLGPIHNRLEDTINCSLCQGIA